MPSESSVDPIHHLTMSMAENSGSAWQIAGVEALTFEGKSAFSQSLSLGLGKIILTIKNKFFLPDSTSNLAGQMFHKCNFFPLLAMVLLREDMSFGGKIWSFIWIRPFIKWPTNFWTPFPSTVYPVLGLFSFLLLWESQQFWRNKSTCSSTTSLAFK